jgi:predicted nuclease of predicted toxin-antitoxin system
MKFLTDVNASGILAQWLTEMGYDVATVSQHNPKMSDEEIINWAVNENRVIVTTDKDFEEMVWRSRKNHCGILRLENLPRADRKSLLEKTLAHHSSDLDSGAIVIAQTRKFRIRQKF